MAKRIFQVINWTPAPTADAATLANNTYMGIKGNTTTQYLDFLEFMLEGMAGASTPLPMTFARSQQLAATPGTPLVAPTSDGPMNPFTAPLAAAPVPFVTATTGGQRSAAVTDAKLTLGLNAFGGIVRWNAAPGQQFSSFGNTATAPAGESYLSMQNAGSAGPINSHIIYEPM